MYPTLNEKVSFVYVCMRSLVRRRFLFQEAVGHLRRVAILFCVGLEFIQKTIRRHLLETGMHIQDTTVCTLSGDGGHGRCR